MEICVTLSANAGVAIEIGGRRIWVDALHSKKQKSFSPVTHELQQQMLRSAAFQRPEFICYTHCHGDHYSESLTDAACALWPDARVLAPEGKYAAVTGEEWTVSDNGLSLRFVRLPHEGEQYRDVLHYGLIISYRGCNILIPGDCATGSEALLQAVGDTPIHLVLLDFPWLALRKGREFVLRHFAQSRVALYHIPFAQDDTWGYREGACRAVKAASQIADLRLMMEPLQQEIFEIDTM